MKKVFFTALLMGFAAASFAGTPTVSKTETKDPTGLYWYPVTYDIAHPDGYVAPNTSLYVQAEQEEVDSPCTPGDNADCLRGFASPLNGSANSDPAPSIKKD